MGVGNLLLADKVTQDEEAILHLGFEPGGAGLDRLAKVVPIRHVEEQHVRTDPVHPVVLAAEAVEDHSKLDFMNDVVGTCVMWDLELGTLGQNATQKSLLLKSA